MLTARVSCPKLIGRSELDAAQALLSVSPEFRPVDALECFFSRENGSALGEIITLEESDVSESEPSLELTAPTSECSFRTASKRDDSLRLKALADAAVKDRESPLYLCERNSPMILFSQSLPCSSSSSSSSEAEDSEAMPPPPPRRRRRSASNPEGMEKWDSLLSQKPRSHFVLPADLLEMELAKASEAVRARELSMTQLDIIPERADDCEEPVERYECEYAPGTSGSGLDSDVFSVEDDKMSPEDLIKRARSRLLEDLAEGNINGDKDNPTLPHALPKYKQFYNMNGRIGVYAPAERAAIILRFNQKRARRVWNKKIRYNCRKDLADRRLRVKGRFVKRSDRSQKSTRSEEKETRRSRKESSNNDVDEDMPDVNDPEAGFVPTEDMPYRRLRRHTVT